MTRKVFKTHKWSMTRIRGCQYVKTCQRCGAWAVALTRRSWQVVGKPNGCEHYVKERVA